MAPVQVNGPDTSEIFAYCRRRSSLYNAKKQVSGVIPWNFGKFLLNEQGKVVKYWGPLEEPNLMREDIEKLLSEFIKVSVETI